MNRELETSYPDNYSPSDLDVRMKVIFEDSKGRKFELPGSKLTAGKCGTWSIRIENHSEDMNPGAVFHLVTLNHKFAYWLQTKDPVKKDYTTLDNKSSAKLHFVTGKGLYHICRIFLKSGIFKKGESFTLKIGERKFGSTGSEVFCKATEGVLLLAADPDGKGRFFGIKQGPVKLETRANDKPVLYRLLGPTVTAVNEGFNMNLGIFDLHGNVVKNFSGTVYFNPDKYFEGLPSKYTFSPSDKGVKIFKGVKAKKTGKYRVKTTGNEIERSFYSNPVVVKENPVSRIYWGDFHCHSWGECSQYLLHMRTEKTDPLSRHMQARKIGRFDFCSPGPMSFPRTERDKIWEAHREACMKMDKPGEYVPFLAYEAHPKGTPGDRNVIFKNLDEKLPPQYDIPMTDLEKNYGKRDDVMLEVHIGGGAPKWGIYRSLRERMVEVCSGHGNAEWLLAEALKNGYKPAVCGCSDAHLEYLGAPKTNSPGSGRFGKVMNYRDSRPASGQLTAVIAPQLARDDLWKAVTGRRTYAAVGGRIYLDITCNGKPSGSEIKPSDNFKFKIECCGTAEIDSVEIISGKYCIYSSQPDSMDFEKEINMSMNKIPCDWVYLRVHQKDDSYAWSSPFWFEYDYRLWDETDNDLLIRQTGEYANKAAGYLDDLIEYLKTEEDFSMFKNITPAGIIEQPVAKCALFYCYYGAGHKMSIRWFFEYEIPRIRYNWGWRDFGNIDGHASFLLE